MSYADQLAKWLRQVNLDTSGVQLSQLARRPDYGELLWQARSDGEAIRRRVAGALYRRYDQHHTPDPRRPIPFSPAAIFYEALAKVGIDRTHILPVSDGNGMKALQFDLSNDVKHNLYGWIFTYPDNRPPDVMIDLGAPPYVMLIEPDPDDPYAEDELPRRLDFPLWLVHASLALWTLIQNWGMHTGYATPGGQVIVPPLPHREPNAVPIAHMFFKALYGLGTYCPRDVKCPCNLVLHQLRATPARHPEMTGAYPAWPYGQHGNRGRGPRATARPGSGTGTADTSGARYQRPTGHPAAPSRPLQPGERLTPPQVRPTPRFDASNPPPPPHDQRDIVRDLGLDDPDGMEIPNGWDDDDDA